MCGIAVRFNSRGLRPDSAWRQRADFLLAHRGPDDSGHYVDGFCELVHRRLSIVDLSSTGHQPMSNEDGNVIVVFNGEIYNHRGLRKQLQSTGHVFQGMCDTEVLVHLYEEHGPRMTDFLRGMFAFAIYDVRARSLLLVRDRFGIKPLYYTMSKGQCIAASEIKAILASSDVVPAIDRQACYDFLGLSYIPEPSTGFRDILALPAGSTLSVTPQGHVLHRYHELEARPKDTLSLQDNGDHLSRCILRAVDAQAAADVPVGALLSGGIDSSLVVAAYARCSPQPLRTFNARFPDRDYDETEVARAVSAHYLTDHRTIDIHEEAQSVDTVVELMTHFDQPFADSSLIPTYMICKAIRGQGIKCAMAGDGGDEAFGGYGRFWRANQFVRMMRFPQWLQSGAIFAGNRLSFLTRDFGRQLAKAFRLAQAGQRDVAVLLAGISNYLSEAEKEELVISGARRGLLPVYRHFETAGPRSATGLEDLSRRMTENLFAVGLRSDMLRKVDMMSMLAGVEVRVPLLDEEVVEIGLGLPHRLKTDGRQGKLVMRILAERWLPRQVTAHQKHGFQIPLDRVFGSQLHQLISDYLLSSQSRTRCFLNPEVPRNWLAMFQRTLNGSHIGVISREGLYQRLFTLLALEMWMRGHCFEW